MLRIGIIGAGPNGTGNARKLAQHDQRCRIAAVADPNRAAAEALAGVYGARVFENVHDVLGDVDAVVISSPNFLHAEQAIACADAGKHVWIEKPMALTLADADRIVAAVTRAKVASMVGFSVRYDAAIWTLRALYNEGRIGPLFSLWSRRLSWFDPAPRASWRTDFAKSGGLLSEILAHEIDWIINMAGMPTSVYCRTTARQKKDPRDNEHVWLTMAFNGDVTGTIEGSSMALVPDYYRGVIGARGALYTQHWGQQLVLQTGKNETQQIEPLQAYDKHAHFLDVIEGRAAPLGDVHAGRAVVAVSEKAIESARSGAVTHLE